MIRALLTAATAVAAIGGAPAAVGDPANPICAKVAAGTICEQDVPRMYSDAVRGEPCTNSQYHYIYERGPNGETLACVAPDGVHGVWSQSVPLFGVQPIGGACPSWIGGAVAQAPDGRSLICAWGQGWVPGPLTWVKPKGHI